MLYPYLTVYFREDLGFAATAIGLILGIRVLSQQGLTVIGGTLADQLGYKPVILSGLALRATGFALLGFADTFPAVLAAAILSGLGGAIFSPGLRAYLAIEAKGQRAEVFALNNVFGQAGTLLGPLLGLALLGLSFRLVAVSAGAVFMSLAILQSRFLPALAVDPGEEQQSVREGWKEVLSNRPFLLFAVAMFGEFTLMNQLYLGLPLELERLTGSQAGVGALFIASAILTISLQVYVTAFCKKRFRAAHAITLGLLLMGLAFVPSLIAASVLSEPGGDSDFRWFSSDALLVLPSILSACLLSLGIMVANPFALETVPRLGKDRLTATYFGVFSMAAGLGATAGNILMGFAFDNQDQIGFQGLPWILMVGIGCACAAFMLVLSRRPEFAEARIHDQLVESR